MDEIKPMPVRFAQPLFASAFSHRDRLNYMLGEYRQACVEAGLPPIVRPPDKPVSTTSVLLSWVYCLLPIVVFGGGLLVIESHPRLSTWLTWAGIGLLYLTPAASHAQSQRQLFVTLTSVTLLGSYGIYHFWGSLSMLVLVPIVLLALFVLLFVLKSLLRRRVTDI